MEIQDFVQGLDAVSRKPLQFCFEVVHSKADMIESYSTEVSNVRIEKGIRVTILQ